ncbi:MAG: DEAD/DEAH box helicase family protein [Armatimonadetes bacterium]|nr:DEAD/DEAH box helicase family protein [Armatimonadota bacterium]
MIEEQTFSELYAKYDLRKARQNPSSKQPHPHQHEAFKELIDWFKERSTSEAGGILVLPTGGGKTFTATRFLCSTVIPAGYKVVWLAHTHHLLEQAFHSFKDSLHTIAGPRETLTARVVSGTPGHFPVYQIEPADDLLIITLQTLTKAYDLKHPSLMKFLKSTNGKLFVVFDEAHHAPAPSYRRLIQNLGKQYPEMLLLGLTATPKYGGSNKSYLGKLFPANILYQINLKQLIARRFLAKPVFKEINTEIEPNFDEAQYRKWVKSYGDIPENILKNLAENKKRNEVIAEEYVKNKKKYGKTIIFADRWYQCEHIKDRLEEKGIRVEAVYSYDGDGSNMAEARSLQDKRPNAEVIADFKNNKCDVLINVRMLTEGTDVPDVQTVFLTRRSTSETLTMQMVGRALRGPQAGGTEEAYIVAFNDRWKQHMRFADFEKLIGDGDKTKTSRWDRAIEYVSISLLRHLIQEIEPGQIPSSTYKSQMPIGFYKIEISVVVENTEDTETFRNLVMVFDDEIEGYKAFIDKILSEDLEKYSSVDIEIDAVQQQLKAWIANAFGNLKNVHAESQLQDCFEILRHVAQNENAPEFFPFEERDAHDLDEIAKYAIEKDFGRKAEHEYLQNIYTEKGKLWSVFYPNYSMFKTRFDSCVNRIMAELNGITPLILPPKPDDGQVIDRTPPSEEMKLQVKQRDHFRCLCCGETTKQSLQIDHIHPRYLGGKNTIDNLQTLCRVCNGNKGIQEINFTVATNGIGQKPLDSLPDIGSPSGNQLRRADKWEQYIRRNINFFYRCAAVNTVTIGQKGDKLRNWEIELFIGNDPAFLRPFMNELLALNR